MFIYDAFGRLEECPHEYPGTMIFICSWVPSRTQKFTIRAKNRTGNHVGYVIYTD
ncbi:MAG: hypothetical protein LBW85_05635 [Deltaproteobacteria bacterium]|jgi:hypothetical protein|nr:hypothetical protein [Deltaproteobacteria bacterium]